MDPWYCHLGPRENGKKLCSSCVLHGMECMELKGLINQTGTRNYVFFSRPFITLNMFLNMGSRFKQGINTTHTTCWSWIHHVLLKCHEKLSMGRLFVGSWKFPFSFIKPCSNAKILNPKNSLYEIIGEHWSLNFCRRKMRLLERQVLAINLQDYQTRRHLPNIPGKQHFLTWSWT